MKNELLKRILSSVALIAVAFFFIIKGSIFFNFFILTVLTITLYEWHFLSLKKIYYLPGIIFIIFSLYTCYFLRSESDYKIFLLILITCISTDIGGYVFGKILKGPKLTKISPNKTYAGMFGGLLLSIISVVVLFYYQNNFNNFISLVNIDFTMTLFLLIILTSLISQIGDLIISYFKRLAKVKDTGNLLPGHGGLLDRVDGIIFALPVSYIIFDYLK